MLVLSRRIDDAIVFPDLGISIEILQQKGNSIRVGIDAPIEVRVLRGELLDSNQKRGAKYRLTGESEHEVRNKLNSLNIASAFARQLIERGEYTLAANKLYDALVEIEGGEENANRSIDVPNPDSSSLSALLVEDVENEREMLAGFLRLHGIQVSSVADAESAVSHLQNNPHPDFMMVDIGLPGISGAELISDVRSNSAYDGIKLFTISGQTPDEAKLNPSANRISKWFQKPLTPSHLISEIEQSVGGFCSVN